MGEDCKQDCMPLRVATLKSAALGKGLTEEARRADGLRKMVEHLRHRLNDAQAGRRRAETEAREWKRLTGQNHQEVMRLRGERRGLARANCEMARTVDRERARVGELETDGAVLRRMLFAAAEIAESMAHQIDAMFPNDGEPEMQRHLRGYAEKFRALSQSEVGAVRGPENMIAEAATEERCKKQQAEAERDALRERCEELDREVARLRNMEPAGRALIPTTPTPDPRDERIAELAAALTSELATRDTYRELLEGWLEAYEREDRLHEQEVLERTKAALAGQGHGSGEGE